VKGSRLEEWSRSYGADQPVRSEYKTSWRKNVLFSHKTRFDNVFKQGFERGETKDEMGPGDLKNFSGNKFFRKVSDLLGRLLHFLLLDYGHPFKDSLTILAL